MLGRYKDPRLQNELAIGALQQSFRIENDDISVAGPSKCSVSSAARRLSPARLLVDGTTQTLIVAEVKSRIESVSKFKNGSTQTLTSKPKDGSTQTLKTKHKDASTQMDSE